MAEVAQLLVEEPLPSPLPYLRIPEAAEFLRRSRSSLANPRQREKLGIPFYRAGHRIVFKRSELEAWLESRRGR
jgi:predicted DNA-binding transcriptional regulator AlpA